MVTGGPDIDDTDVSMMDTNMSVISGIVSLESGLSMDDEDYVDNHGKGWNSWGKKGERKSEEGNQKQRNKH